MKEPFDIMVRTSLEDYVVKRVVPELRDRKLRDSKKTNIGLSPWEHLGLVILSFFQSWLNDGKAYVPAINNENHDDGAVADIENNSFIPVEQVFVYEKSWDNNIIQGIKDALSQKNKGSEYASGLILLVFCNAEGDFKPDTIKKELKESYFRTVLILGQTGKEEFGYYIVLAKNDNIIINKLFELSINPNNGKCFIGTPGLS